MKISEAYPICTKSVNIPFKNLFSYFCKDEIRKNKSKSGKLMEKPCSLNLSNKTTDFENGALKSSELKESTAITMISDRFDDISYKNPHHLRNLNCQERLNT